MSLKTGENILSVFEIAILLLSIAAWAALGFPALKSVVLFGALCLVSIGAFYGSRPDERDRYDLNRSSRMSAAGQIAKNST